MNFGKFKATGSNTPGTTWTIITYASSTRDQADWLTLSTQQLPDGTLQVQCFAVGLFTETRIRIRTRAISASLPRPERPHQTCVRPLVVHLSKPHPKLLPMGPICKPVYADT